MGLLVAQRRSREPRNELISADGAESSGKLTGVRRVPRGSARRWRAPRLCRELETKRKMTPAWSGVGEGLPRKGTGAVREGKPRSAWLRQTEGPPCAAHRVLLLVVWSPALGWQGQEGGGLEHESPIKEGSGVRVPGGLVYM